MQREPEWGVYTLFPLLTASSPPFFGDSVSRHGFNVNLVPFSILTALSITVTWNCQAWWLTTISWQWPQMWRNGQFIMYTAIWQQFSGNEKALPPQWVHRHTCCVSRHSSNANSVMFSNTTIFWKNPMSWQISYCGRGISLTFKLLLTLTHTFRSPCPGKYATCASR